MTKVQQTLKTYLICHMIKHVLVPTTLSLRLSFFWHLFQVSEWSMFTSCCFVQNSFYTIIKLLAYVLIIIGKKKLTQKSYSYNDSILPIFDFLCFPTFSVKLDYLLHNKIIRIQWNRQVYYWKTYKILIANFDNAINTTQKINLTLKVV